MAGSNRFQPKTGRLLLLLVPAVAYLVWASSFRAIDEVSLADGSIGVLLGLYICSQPAANGIELMFLERGGLRRVAARWNGIGWLTLNLLVMIVGWLVLVVGATQFTGRSAVDAF